MDIKHSMDGNSPGNPGPIPFSMSSPDQVLEGTIAIRPYLGNPVNQICGLERKTARGGKDRVDHAPLAHDDLANAALGAAWLVAGKAQRYGFSTSPLLGI